MRSERRRRPLEHVLIAGHLADIAAIRSIVGHLPEHTYGQVLLETDGVCEAPALRTPARVTVSLLPRISRPGRPAPPSGALLADAVAAWTAEWMPDEPQPGREITVWIGGQACECVNEVCDRLAALPERL